MTRRYEEESRWTHGIRVTAAVPSLSIIIDECVFQPTVGELYAEGIRVTAAVEFGKQW